MKETMKEIFEASIPIALIKNKFPRVLVKYPNISHRFVSFQYPNFEYAKDETYSKGIDKIIWMTAMWLNLSNSKKITANITKTLANITPLIATLAEDFSGIVVNIFFSFLITSKHC